MLACSLPTLEPPTHTPPPTPWAHPCLQTLPSCVLGITHSSPRLCFLPPGRLLPAAVSLGSPLPPYCSWNSVHGHEERCLNVCIALQWTTVSPPDHLASKPSSQTWGVFHFLDTYLALSKQKTPDTHSTSFLSLKQGLLTCLLQSDIIHPWLDSEMCGPKRQSPRGPHAGQCACSGGRCFRGQNWGLVSLVAVVQTRACF